MMIIHREVKIYFKIFNTPLLIVSKFKKKLSKSNKSEYTQ